MRPEVLIEAIESLGTHGSRTGVSVIYRTTPGTTATATSIDADRSSTATNTVVATFKTGEINDLIAGGVTAEGSVWRPNGISGKDDVKGLTSTFAAGAFLGPQLASVARSTVTDLSGTVTKRRIDFVWDQAITTTAGPYNVYAADGTKTILGTGGQGTCAKVSAAIDATGKTVRCQLNTTAGGGGVLENLAATAVANARLAGVPSATVTTVTQLQAPTGTAVATQNHSERTSI